MKAGKNQWSTHERGREVLSAGEYMNVREEASSSSG